MGFSANPVGIQFQIFYPPHLIALGIILAINLAFIPFKKYADERTRKTFRYGLAAFLILTEITYNVWRAAVGIWSIQENLPFHLCSVLIILSAILLVTKNYTLYEIVYFMGIAGATQPLLTPDIDIYGYPHLRFFTSFITHGTIVTTAIYMTVVEGMRPTWASVWRVLGMVAAYGVVIFGLNFLIGSNYLFIAHKPEVPTLIDVLGPWPFYILALAGIALVMSLILYLPFAIKDWRAARHASLREEGQGA